METKLSKKLATLPTTPGVYFHKDAAGQVIYIGKAANLRNRVRQYFQKSRYRDPKTDVLTREITDVDWRELDSEADALFLEAELVRRYQPKFNIELRDDKSQLFVRINYKSEYPTVTLVRRPMDDGSEYFGPYMNSLAIKKALRYLRRAFPYAISRPANQRRSSLYYHLGLDPGLEDGKTSLEQYRANLRKLMQYLRGERVALVREIERQMRKAAKAHDFEAAARYRNQLLPLRELNRQVLFSDKELMDAARDEALAGLCRLLGLDGRSLRRVEGFDISHMQGTDTVASMVVFTNGLPDKSAYRKFKMRLAGNDDFGHMNEVIRRRLRDENVKKWGIGDLMLIDGGKGQLTAAQAARDDASRQDIPMIGLAKKREEIIIHKAASIPGFDEQKILAEAVRAKAYIDSGSDFISITLPDQSPVVKLLQRIRDESHRFAVSYHSTLKRGRVAKSILDDIPGIGPATRRKLLRHFGSMRALARAEPTELQKLLGPKKGEELAKLITAYRD